METLIICPNQIAEDKREREREKKATIAIADKSFCLHISIPSMYDTTIKHQQ
jgi:hypothetical protein